jgi:N-acyl-D-amino-acid deacylase
MHPLSPLPTSVFLASALFLAGCDPEPPPPADAGPPVTAERPGAGDPADTPRLSPANAAPSTADLLIRGGLLVDGSGATPVQADLLVRDGIIVHVGPVDPGAVEVDEAVDASGRVVTPGFIDAHAHGDPVDAPRFPNFLAMGVTTVILGQDGSSPEAAAMAARFDAVEAARPSVNVGYLLGHNTLRQESGVGHAPPSPEGSRRMAALVEQALAAGALGLSTGLEYSPGMAADVDELAAIAVPVAEAGGVVMSHMRSEDADQVEASLAELLEQGRRSGAAVHVSHLKVVLGSDTAQARRILDALAAHREAGHAVTADVYPYTASFTGISILFPDWARPPHDYDSVRRQRGQELAEHLRNRVNARNGPEATLFGSGELPGFGGLGGHTLAQVAEAVGRPFEEVLVELGPGGARAAYFVMDEAVMEAFLLDPWVAISSDGSPTMSHPRGYGSFPRVIRRWVIENERLALEEAVRKMTGLPASILGLDDPDHMNPPRGRLEEGWAADILVFDPANLRDRADFEAPHRLAGGMDGVWVNGVRLWRDGQPTGAPGSGTALRRPVSASR